jgi:hypothetical protein
MDATYFPESARTVASSGIRLNRVAGFAGLFFAIFVGLINVLVGTMAPPAFDASASEIATFLTDNRTLLTAVASVVPFGVIALFVFLSASFPALSAASPESAFWARFGAVGLILIEVMFLTRMLFEFVIIANVKMLATEPALLETIWQFQNAAMTMNGLAIGLALLGLSRAGRISGLIPAWQQVLGLGAAAAFLVAALGVIPALEGSLIGMLGLPAFLAWLLFLALTSLRFLRCEQLAVGR